MAAAGRRGEGATAAGRKGEGGNESVTLKKKKDQEMAEQIMLESDQPDFDFRLSMLPAWARKMAMSRPSVMPQADLRRVHSVDSITTEAPSTSRSVEGRWAEVNSCRKHEV